MGFLRSDPEIVDITSYIKPYLTYRSSRSRINLVLFVIGYNHYFSDYNLYSTISESDATKLLYNDLLAFKNKIVSDPKNFNLYYNLGIDHKRQLFLFFKRFELDYKWTTSEITSKIEYIEQFRYGQMFGSTGGDEFTKFP